MGIPQRIIPAIFLAIAFVLSGFVVLPSDVSATASDTHFAVLSDAACSVGTFATDADCWSHTSGGAGGAGVPGPNNAVVFDANSGPPSGQTGDQGDTGFGDPTLSVDSITFSSCPTRTYVFDQNVNTNSIAFTSGTCTAQFGSAESSMTLTLNGDVTGSCCVSYSADTSTVTWTTGITANIPYASFGYMTVPSRASITITGSSASVFNNMLRVDGMLTTPGPLSGIDFFIGTDPVTEAMLDVGSDGSLVHGAVTIHNFEMLSDEANSLIEIESWAAFSPDNSPFVDMVISSGGVPAVTWVIGGVDQNFAYEIYRDGTLIATDTDANTEARLTISGGWGGSSADERIQILRGLRIRGEGGGGPPPPPAGGGWGSQFNWFSVTYLNMPTFPFPVRRACLNVTLEDTRREASLAIQYVWSFGDGFTEITTGNSVTHAYEEEGLYTVTVRVQYRGGGIDIFLINVNTKGTECFYSQFVQVYGPILIALAGLALLSAVIVSAQKYRIEKKKRIRISKIFLAIALVALGILGAVVIYAAAAGIPL